MRPSEFVRLIKKHGYRFDHHGTNHDFYKDKNGNMIMVERHNKEINTKTLDRMMKDVGLK